MSVRASSSFTCPCHAPWQGQFLLGLAARSARAHRKHPSHARGVHLSMEPNSHASPTPAAGEGERALKQRIRSSHIPPCHRHMVIATTLSVHRFAALQHKPDQCRILRGIRGGGAGTRPWCWFVCLWRRLLASRRCTFRPSAGPNVSKWGGGGAGAGRPIHPEFSQDPHTHTPSSRTATKRIPGVVASLCSAPAYPTTLVVPPPRQAPLRLPYDRPHDSLLTSK